MNAIVKSIMPGSYAAKTKITPGDVLRRINGNVIGDVLDYQFHSCDSRLLLEFTGTDGKIKLIRLGKPEGADIGLEFESYLMDKERSCANKCIFCFIDQLPEGMRDTLYYKDDDVRLSFLHGNYITLTNLSRKDIERIIKLRISPVNVSVHTLDPKLRAYMLGNKKGGEGIAALEALVNAGITVNCQIVCCPGINDGPELSKTIEGLIELGEGVNSVSIVPVGLTKHRQGLAALRPFDKTLALQTIRLAEHYGSKCTKSRDSRVFFCADELYMLAELELPPDEYYEDYPQLENGVGMMRSFITEFEDDLNKSGSAPHFTGALPAQSIELSSTFPALPAQSIEPYPRLPSTPSRISIVTGALAQPFLTKLLKTAIDKYGTIIGEVYAVKNDFFGESVTVSGLITGGDVIKQLKGKELGTKLLIPQNMLRRGEDVFLDNVTVPELSNTLGVPVRVVKQNGAEFLLAILGY